MDEISPVDVNPKSVGVQLKSAREQMGMSLADLAAKTRVPMRHLESIERSEFGALPGQTYTVGFVRSYARAVKLDEISIVNTLRNELSRSGHEGYQAPLQNYEPADPARVPSKSLAWTAAAIAAIVLAAYLVFRSFSLAPAADAPRIVTPQAKVDPKPTTAANTGGVVVLTATDNVWVKIYDADQKRLFEQEMAAGDSYSVPPNANRPMIVTGRPQALDITVGGKAVPPLGAPDKTIADVGISAQDLLARVPAPNASAS
ncbi:helix-turn-helix domain-containing protein [Sphingorhabdus sp.]|uniref:helix-turn-helix domain-containing protein n=1 Tax=Sphingorhabdus sp. TaxID=1902408 RepID=UPI00391D1476